MHPPPDPSGWFSFTKLELRLIRIKAKSWISDDGYAMVVNSRGVVEKWTVITRPTEEIKDVKHLQAEMEIDSPDKVELYEEIRRFIRLEILATMTEEQRLLKWHRVPAHCKSDVYIAALDRHPYLRRFDEHWASEEIMKSVLRNFRDTDKRRQKRRTKPQAPKRKASAAEMAAQKRRRTQVEASTKPLPTHTAPQDQESTHEELNVGEELNEDEESDANNSDKSQLLPDDTGLSASRRPSTPAVKRTKRNKDTETIKRDSQKASSSLNTWLYSPTNAKSKSSSKKVDKASHTAGSSLVITVADGNLKSGPQAVQDTRAVSPPGSEGSWEAHCQEEIAELSKKSNSGSASKETGKAKVRPKMRPVPAESDSDDATTPQTAKSKSAKKAKSVSRAGDADTDRSAEASKAPKTRKSRRRSQS
ncbi:hypothetical protein FRC12_012077 [Ceratobasidium sp. 428]|nr:hypothetical protein FRC12_012077 [Ceratobasidium sp. 428]